MHPLFRLQCDREWTKSWKYRHQQQQSHVGCAISWWQNKDLKSIAWIMLRSIGSILIAQMTIDWCLNSGRNTTQLITEWNVTHSRQSLNVTYNGQYQEHVQLAKRAVVFSTLHSVLQVLHKLVLHTSCGHFFFSMCNYCFFFWTAEKDKYCLKRSLPCPWVASQNNNSSTNKRNQAKDNS